MNNIKVFWMISFALGLGLLIYFPGGELARSHVNEKTAVTDHPLTCTNCHLYITKNEYISKLVNEDYLSPLNLTVSEDGKHLFVVAQDGDAARPFPFTALSRDLIANPLSNDLAFELRK